MNLGRQLLFGEGSLIPRIPVFTDSAYKTRMLLPRKSLRPPSDIPGSEQKCGQNRLTSRRLMGAEFHGGLEGVVAEGQDLRVIIQRKLSLTGIFSSLKRYFLGLPAHFSWN